MHVYVHVCFVQVWVMYYASNECFHVAAFELHIFACPADSTGFWMKEHPQKGQEPFYVIQCAITGSSYSFSRRELHTSCHKQILPKVLL